MLSFGPSLTDRNSNQWSKWSVWSNAHLQQKVLKILFWTKSMNMNSWNYLRIPIPYYTQIFGAIRWSSSRFFCQRALSKFTFNKNSIQLETITYILVSCSYSCFHTKIALNLSWNPCIVLFFSKNFIRIHILQKIYNQRWKKG